MTSGRDPEKPTAQDREELTGGLNGVRHLCGRKPLRDRDGAGGSLTQARRGHSTDRCGHGPPDEDLRPGLAGAAYKVAFETDVTDTAARRGWSVLVQGPAHHVTGAEEDAVRAAGVESWAPGDRELFVRIVPSRVTGRRVGPPEAER